MSSTTSTHPRMAALSELLGRELKHGEWVLWKGQPEADALLIRKLEKLWAYYLLLVASAVLSCINPNLWPVTLGLFIGMLVLLYKPFRTFFASRNWLYTVTSQRIIFIEINRGTVITSYSRMEIVGSNLLKKYGNDGLGDLIFRGRKTFGFVAIKDASTVAGIIDAAFFQPATQTVLQRAYVQH